MTPTPPHFFSHAGEAIFTLPARRPVLTLVVAAFVLAAAGLGLMHIRINTSLQTMFPEGKPSADAMVRVLDDFPASGELIVLASDPAETDASPGDARGRSAAKLLAFAQRLEETIKASPEASALTAGVIYRVGPEVERFSRQVVVPGGLYYLDDAAFSEARARLTPEGMRRQIDQDLGRLAQPGVAGSAAKEFLKDPLGLIQFVWGRVAGQRQFKTWQNGQDFISPDGGAILIRIVGKQPPSNLDYCEKLVKAVSAAADGANTGGLKLDYTGAYAAADFSHHAIRKDSIESVFVSIILLQLLFLFVYRRPFRQFLLEISPVIIGVFFGFGLYGWSRGGLSPVAAVIGGILAGMGIDYSVLYLAAYFRHLAVGRTPVEAVRLTAVQTVGPLFTAWCTSAIGFITVIWSSVPTLRDFGLLGTMGLVGTIASVLFVVPAVVTLWDTKRLARNDSPATRKLPFRWDVRPLLGFVQRRRRWLIAASVLIFIAAAVIAGTRPGGPLPLESDLNVMHPQPNPVLAAEPEIARRFGAEPGALVVLLKGKTSDDLLRLSYEVDRRLSQPQIRAAGIVGSAGLASLLPDPTVTEHRKPLPEAEVTKIVADFKAAMTERDFEPAAYEPYAEFLQSALMLRLGPDGKKSAAALPPPGVESLRQFPELWRSMLPSSAAAGEATPNEAITLVFVDQRTDQRESRLAMVAAARSALAGLEGATLTGLPVISLDTEDATSHDLPMLMAIAATLVLVVLLLYYRSIARTALALLPLLFSLVVLAAVARVTNTRLNLINLVALPLLVGIDVDYGIYMVSMAGRRKTKSAPDTTGTGATAADGNSAEQAPLATRMAASTQAVLTCAAASALGFGSLMTVSVPAVRSLGLVVSIGVISSLIGTFALRAPVLMEAETHE